MGAVVTLQDEATEEYSSTSSSSNVLASSSCNRIASRLHELQSLRVVFLPFPVSE